MGRCETSYDVHLPQLGPQGVIRPRRVDLPPFTPSAVPRLESPIFEQVYAYLGIPFALPPIAHLRWKVPQRLSSASSTTGPYVRESRFGADAPQNIREQLSISPGRKEHAASVGQSEDCLTLNIWVPKACVDAKNNGFSSPVAVWIHGGGFSFGSASMAIYDGARLAAEQRIVVVSVQYRVGPIGFLGGRHLSQDNAGPNPYFAEIFKALGTAGHGNYGLWDVAAALQWVQENIHHFGGDRHRVTAWGQSAGAIIIHYLMLSPHLPGNLFKRAILQSGSASVSPPRSEASATATFDFLITQLRPALMQAAAEEQVGALRRCSHQELTYALSPLLPTRHPRTEYQHGRPHRPPIRPQKTLLEPLNAWGPICDGVMVSTDWRNDAKCGYLNGNGGQGIVVGWTVDEGSMYTLQLLDPEILKREILKSNAHNHETIRHLYDLEHVDSEHHASAVASAYIGDSLFHANILSLVHRLANDPLSPPTHAQCYALRTSPPALMATTNAAEVIGEYFGCMHTGDVPYAFGFDGTEPHTRHPGDVYGVAVGAPPSAPPRLGTPFQAHELELCQRLMGSWGAFIRGEGMQDWPTVQSMRSIGPQKEVSLEQLPVLALGDAAQIGDANGSGSRDVMVKMLGELAFWRSVVMPGAATVKERIEWWSHSEVRFLECYGRADYNEM